MCSDGWFIGFNYVSFSTLYWVVGCTGRDAKISSIKKTSFFQRRSLHKAEDMGEHCFFKKMGSQNCMAHWFWQANHGAETCRKPLCLVVVCSKMYIYIYINLVEGSIFMFRNHNVWMAQWFPMILQLDVETTRYRWAGGPLSGARVFDQRPRCPATECARGHGRMENGLRTAAHGLRVVTGDSWRHGTDHAVAGCGDGDGWCWGGAGWRLRKLTTCDFGSLMKFDGFRHDIFCGCSLLQHLHVELYRQTQ